MYSKSPFEISEFEIKGFKCIPYWDNETSMEIPVGERTVEIKASYLYKLMDLGNFIVMTGNNATGKSTFLQALFLALGSGLKKFDSYELQVDDKHIVLDLAYKYMGLSSEEELKYLFHRVKKPEKMIDFASDRIMIRLKLVADTEASIELFFEKNNGNIDISVTGYSSLEEFSPRIDDIYVFQPIYPADTPNHSGLFSAKGLGELDVPIEIRIGEEYEFNSFVINFIYRLTQIIGEDKKLPFLQVPIQFIPLGAYVSSRLELVRTIQEIKRKIYNTGANTDIANIFIFEEPEIGLHPILQKKFVRKIYSEFFDENGRRVHGERNIVIIVTQSDHILNEAIVLAHEKRDDKNFIPTFIDCCQKIVKVKDRSNKSTISCLYQKYYPDYGSPGTISPYRNDLERTNKTAQYNICEPHSFIEALLYGR